MKTIHAAEPPHPSPLQLIYSAYASEQPITDAALSAYFESLEKKLSSLPERDKHAIFRSIYNIYTKKENQAFLAGLRAGIQLIFELSEI